MGNSKRIVIILIVVVAILIIALTGAILYILVNKNTENLNNKTIVNTDKLAETNMEEDTNKIKESINNMEVETFNSIFKSVISFDKLYEDSFLIFTPNISYVLLSGIFV